MRWDISVEEPLPKEKKEKDIAILGMMYIILMI